MDRLTGSLSSTGSLSGSLSAAPAMSGIIQFADSTPYYRGEYEVTPEFFDQTLETRGKRMTDNVTVERIYVNSVQNTSGGNTVYIGGIINDG